MNPQQPPNDQEAESSVLGGIFLENEKLYEVAEILKTEDFYRGRNGMVFEAMLALASRQEPVDTVLVGAELQARGHFEEVGGKEYLEMLACSVPASSNLLQYAKVVADKAALRRLAAAAMDTYREAMAAQGDISGILDRAGQRMLTASERKASRGPQSIKTLVREVYRDLEERYERQSAVTGISTGFEELDKRTTGFKRGDLIILAGRPSMGKTACAMNVAGHVACDLKLPVVVFELEMSAKSLTERLLGSVGGVNGSRIQSGLFLDHDWPKLARAATALHQGVMDIDDTPGITVMEIRSKCRRLMSKRGQLGLVVVDYLQLMRGSGKSDSPEQEVAEISQGLKLLARELQCPVIALSQLNRSLEKRTDKRPIMSDLRGSGAIEQDADLIGFLYRDEVYDKQSKDKGIAEFIIGKQRNGPIGTVALAFEAEFVRFENLMDQGRRDEDDRQRRWG